MPVNRNEFFNEFEKMPMLVSPQAQKMIYAIIEAIYEDPYRGWKTISSPELDSMARQIAKRLPSFLGEIMVMNPQLKNTGITTFDVLHWLSMTHAGKSNLDRICPFDK